MGRPALMGGGWERRSRRWGSWCHEIARRDAEGGARARDRESLVGSRLAHGGREAVVVRDAAAGEWAWHGGA